MNPGRMNHSITIEENSGGEGGYGGSAVNWTTLATVWADVVWVGSKERFLSDKDTPVKAAKAYIWFRTDVKESHRVSYDGDVYDITGIKELGFKEGLELTMEMTS